MLTHGERPVLFFCNPNIYPIEEYEIRKQELIKHAEKLGLTIIDDDYEHDKWLEAIRGMEDEPERGARCLLCFKYRLLRAAHKTQELGLDTFTTTLASSRWKSLPQITEAGTWAAEQVKGVTFDARNWRKGGLQERRNILLKENGFYNQLYCGCEFSLKAMKAMGKLCLAIILCMSGVWTSCSTTNCIEEGEQLYTGIEEITFNLDPTQRKLSKKERKRLEKQTEKGVITAVNDAVVKIGDIINGTERPATDKQDTQKNTADREAFAHSRYNDRIVARAEKVRAEQLKAVQDEVNAVLAYAPNGALFGSNSIVNPMQLRLRIHNRYCHSKSKFGKWMLRVFGEEPVLVSTVVPQTRAKVATNQLHNYGYFRATTQAEVIPQSNPQKAKVKYHITTGPLYLIDSISISGFPIGIDTLMRHSRRYSHLKRGAAFSAANLANERIRVEELLHENGYYFWPANGLTYKADTINHPLYATLRIEPEATLPQQATQPWKMGRTFITLYDNGGSVTDTTIGRRSIDYRFHGPTPPLKMGMWRRAISHRRGQLYRRSEQESTLEKLTAMGVLSQVAIDYLPSSDNEGCDTLNTYITAVMDKLYESSFEMNATLKSNHQFGPGISYELAKKNAFRGGEKVAWKIFGQYEWYVGKGGSSVLNSYELGSELSLTFPQFLFPGLRRTRMPATTKLAADIDWKNRSGYFNMLQFGINATYNWHRRSNRLHELTVFDFEFNRMFSQTDAFNEIVQSNPALYVSMRNQFVPSITYTYTHTTTSKKSPLWYQLSVKEAGNLTSGIAAVCGNSWSKTDKEVLGSPFAQFLKITGEVHKTWTLSQRFLLATRFFGGAIFTYGNSTAAPYADLFYAGGANSVRAFAARAIGPGGYKSTSQRHAYIDQMGDVKLEANIELRAKLIGNLNGAVFLDAGNVWLMHDDPLRQNSHFTADNIKRIALGTGLGLRYDLTFLVLRADLGIGLHAPYTTKRSGFYNLEHFKDGLAFHLAIGYPF